jgi:peptide deformylase
MILPVVAYGHPVLRKIAEDIDKDYPGLKELIQNMWETMRASSGIGLAAPQVNRPIRLFLVDATPLAEDNPALAEFRKAFINPEIIEESGEEWVYNEGCLSLPGLREDISRKPIIKIQYYDEDFNYHEDTFDGMAARIIQHEYDHLEGTLLVDRVNPLKKMMLKRKLSDISKGNVDVDYRMLFPAVKKR